MSECKLKLPACSFLAWFTCTFTQTHAQRCNMSAIHLTEKTSCARAFSSAALRKTRTTCTISCFNVSISIISMFGRFYWLAKSDRLSIKNAKLTFLKKLPVPAIGCSQLGMSRGIGGDLNKTGMRPLRSRRLIRRKLRHCSSPCRVGKHASPATPSLAKRIF